LQAPETHCCPVTHGDPDPHLQAPPAQVSALTLLQLVQPPPPVPQLAVDCPSHVVPLQQPFGHDVGVQAH
jgi:hypothetical protein